MDPSLVSNVVVPLLAAHLLVDFLFQTRRDVDGKRRGCVVAYAKHGVQHGLAAWAMCGMLGAWSLALVLMIVHTAIDAGKEALAGKLAAREDARRQDGDEHPPGDEDGGDHDDGQQDDAEHARPAGRPLRAGLWLFLGDQTLHVLSILVLAGVWSGLSDDPSLWLWARIGWVQTVMLVGAGYLAATVVGGYVIGPFVKPFLDEIERNKNSGSSRGLSEGGKTIGMLERTLIFVLILAGIESGVGFLVAAKSILRFGELKDAEQRMEAEYIIIGTFLSFTWAIGCGWATRSLLTMTALA